mmetsp:Transcript_10898/g.9405  ORF Transcript_10898/g.9405 Transcript_10898/m.9405 type:complete len:87 (+) Transcript_10898:48-308(+)
MHLQPTYQYFGEFLGLFILFITINLNISWPISAFAVGFTLLIIINLCVKLSGSEFNAAVTFLEYLRAKKSSTSPIPNKRFTSYVLA